MERKKRKRLLGVYALALVAAFSMTVLTGAVAVQQGSNSFFTATVANENNVQAGEYCVDEHKNGDDHKPHPPGEGNGHCKPKGDDQHDVLPEEAEPTVPDATTPESSPSDPPDQGSVSPAPEPPESAAETPPDSKPEGEGEP